MRILFWLLLASFPLSLSAQRSKRNEEDEKRIQLIDHSYQVMKLDSSRDDKDRFVISSIISTKDQQLTKDQVFEVIKFTIYKNFGSGDKVVQYENKGEGKIYCRARTNEFPYYNSFVRKNGGAFMYEITALCKDGKAKVTIHNIIHQAGDMAQMESGSDFGDNFPSTWRANVGKPQSQDQWIKIKNMAHLDLITTVGLFQEALLNAKSKKEEF